MLRTRILIERVTNGAKLRSGEWTRPIGRSLMGEAQHPYYDFGVPRLFIRDGSTVPGDWWPKEAPEPWLVTSVCADVGEPGNLVCAEFKGGDGWKPLAALILPIDAIENLARTLAAIPQGEPKSKRARADASC